MLYCNCGYNINDDSGVDLEIICSECLQNKGEDPHYTPNNIKVINDSDIYTEADGDDDKV